MSGGVFWSAGSMCGGLGGAVLLCVLVGSVQGGSGQAPGLGEEIRPAWPNHTVCSVEGIHVMYTSCDPVQDIGISISPCPPINHHANVRLSAPLRYSVQELYLTVDVLIGGQLFTRYEETLCRPDFPRFSFCNRLRGEMVHFERLLRVKWPLFFSVQGVKIGEIGGHAVLSNQDGQTVFCFNVTVNSQGG